MKNDTKIKEIICLIIALVLSTFTTMVAFKTGLNPPMGFLIGCVSAFVAATVVCFLLKVPQHLYILTLVFVYMASPLGSIMNFYRSIDSYDKVVHFFSGLLIAAFGYVFITKLLPVIDQRTKLIACIFAFLFASAGAGIWEIFEFATDKMAGGGMQRGMVDTVTDMIAGNIGGMLYGVILWFKKQH